MPDVRVPQKSGSITVSRLGEKTEWKVTNHIVTVAAADLERFLVNAPEGSRVVEKPSASTKKES